MESVGIGGLLKLLLVLFLSAPDSPKDGGRGLAIETLAPAGAIGYASLDIAQLRVLVRTDPEVAKALFVDRTAEASFGEALGAMSEQTNVDPATLREAIARVRTIGLWGMGMVDRERPRFIAVFDRGDAPDILAKLLDGRTAGKGGAFRTMTYAGRTLYAVGPDARKALWLTEINGMLVLASDSLAAEAFLLKARTAPPAPPAAKVDTTASRTLLQVRGDVGTVVNGLLPGLGHHDQAEFMAIASFFDLAAWRGALLRVDGDSIVLRAEIDPGSPLAAALKPPERVPAILDAIPAAAPLALAVSVRDTAKVWDLLETGFAHVAIFDHGGTSPREAFIRDFRRSTGLDVQADVVSNLVAVAVVLTDPDKRLRLDRGGAVYFEGKDATNLLTSVRAILARIQKEDRTASEDRQGVKVWRTDETLVALKGNVVMMAPCRGEAQSSAERLLKHFVEGGESLRKTLAARQPGASAFATIDGARCFPQSGLDRVTAGLTCDATGVTLRVEGGGRNLAAGIVRMLAGVGRAATAQAAQSQTINGLRLISHGCEQYTVEHGKMPGTIADIKVYIKNADVVLRDARTGQALLFNTAVAGLPREAIKNPGATVLAYTAPGQTTQPICVVFCDGNFRNVTLEQLNAMLSPATRADGSR